MSLDTYANLKAQILIDVDRSDAETTAAVPDRISIVESDVIRKLGVREMEKRATALSVQGEATVQLPSDYVAIRYLRIDGNPTVPLVELSPHALRSQWDEGDVGEPRNFSIVGSHLLLGPTPSGEMTLNMGYYAFDKLSDSNTSNWLLAAHPDVYLYGGLMHLSVFLKDPEGTSAYRVAYLDALSGIKSLDRRSRFGAQLQIQSDVGRP